MLNEVIVMRSPYLPTTSSNYVTFFTPVNLITWLNLDQVLSWQNILLLILFAHASFLVTSKIDIFSENWVFKFECFQIIYFIH